MAAGRKMLMLFAHSEAWRAMFCFTKWSRSLRGAQLSICNDRIQEKRTRTYVSVKFVLCDRVCLRPESV